MFCEANRQCCLPHIDAESGSHASLHLHPFHPLLVGEGTFSSSFFQPEVVQSHKSMVLLAAC